MRAIPPRSIEAAGRKLAGALLILTLAGACHREDGAAPAEPTSAPAVAASPASPPVPVAEQVAATMELWRRSILDHDADNVMACDGLFLEKPGTYLSALVKSAESDPDERVRAFSTRVLGKFQDATLGPRLLTLLSAPSPLVRQNAAWALGALPPDVARPALERALHDDPSPDVRRNADEAIKRLGHPPRVMR